MANINKTPYQEAEKYQQFDAFNNLKKLVIFQTNKQTENQRFNQQIKFNVKLIIWLDLNDQFLYQRRQNILNTRFNARMNRLLRITKQNKKIHERINAQESFYSSRTHSRSSNSRCSHRSSISKESNRNQTLLKSRGTSLISSKLNTKILNQKKQKLKIQSQSIKTVNINSIQGFLQIFSTAKQNINSKKQIQIGQSNKFWKSSSKQNSKSLLPPIHKKYSRPNLQKIKEQPYELKNKILNQTPQKTILKRLLK